MHGKDNEMGLVDVIICGIFVVVNPVLSSPDTTGSLCVVGYTKPCDNLYLVMQSCMSTNRVLLNDTEEV